MLWNKPLSPLLFLITYLIPLLAIWGYQQGGLFNFCVPIFVFGLIPLIDHLVGKYAYNPSEEETLQLLQDKRFNLVAWGLMPVTVGLVIWGAWIVTHVQLSTIELIGLTLSIGLCSGGLGINLAHELIHKPTTHERMMGQLLLMNTFYMHFYIEHILGHHQRIATPEDPASARKGESLYHFYLRSVFGSFKSAWGIEAKRLSKNNLAIWSQHNRMLWFVFWPIAYMSTLSFAFGWQVIPFFLIQSVIGFSLLEGVNYVEHYGLVRQKNEAGYYEKVSIEHSWNANQLLTNCFLFMLQRHSDHHAHQSRRFQILRQFDESPQLPTGYAGMLVLALFPPLWKRVMDPRVNAYYGTSQQDVSLKVEQAHS